MSEAAKKLLSDPKKLHAIVAQKAAREQHLVAEVQARDETIRKLERQIAILLERLELLRHREYGHRC